MNAAVTTHLKRTALVAMLAGIAALIVFVLRTDGLPGLPLPDILEQRWGRAEPLKQQTQERVRAIDFELPSQ